MRFASPLLPATLVRRYKRFLADVVLPSGEEITAHVANPGAMTGLAAPGARVWLSKSDDPKRKLPYAWELVEVDLGAGVELVGVNTAHPNRLVHEALAAASIPECAGYPSLRREVRYGKRFPRRLLPAMPAARRLLPRGQERAPDACSPASPNFPTASRRAVPGTWTSLATMAARRRPRDRAVPDPDRLGDALCAGARHRSGLCGGASGGRARAASRRSPIRARPRSRGSRSGDPCRSSIASSSVESAAILRDAARSARLLRMRLKQPAPLTSSRGASRERRVSKDGRLQRLVANRSITQW